MMDNNFSLARACEPFFRIGAAVSPRVLRERGDLIRQHFNSLTAENEMKYDRIEPEEGHFRFEQADEIVAFARGMGIKIRAHAPVWHNQTPAWMYRDGDRPAPPEMIYERIDRHTKAICERYGGDVYCWDVVNEATRDGAPGPGEDPVYRDSDYFRLCGPAFIEAAFRSMDRYAPDAQLFYNDYSECVPEKRERIVSLIRDLKEKGCRVDGVGMQQHHFAPPDYDEIKRSIEIYASMGLRIHVTELDISMMAVLNTGAVRLRPGDDGFEEYIREAARADEGTLSRIGDIYVRLFGIYRSYAGVIDCVTTWGVSDDRTWLDHFGVSRGMPFVKQHPLLFDESGQPKPFLRRLTGNADRPEK
ncbi:MAG: endo-1,4-beta-xylanase [Clostridia bacterium]|nr:endo-1,4-beta-xylanase [Clostridia bacterium]